MFRESIQLKIYRIIGNPQVEKRESLTFCFVSKYMSQGESIQQFEDNEHIAIQL